ncbi:hypothetical protein Agub_g3143 [Astrephomene gubernaculifera]|uniref:Uncharacterized protein n=1 Tax=Astrephomene gubernaculifera TaxID=47775 RepID=A0AAD3DJB0_9CHLO|nr:hypothetical protein Agub_g3143 [Astrephomene gubernaculifera]
MSWRDQPYSVPRADTAYIPVAFHGGTTAPLFQAYPSYTTTPAFVYVPHTSAAVDHIPSAGAGPCVGMMLADTLGAFGSGYLLHPHSSSTLQYTLPQLPLPPLPPHACQVPTAMAMVPAPASHPYGSSHTPSSPPSRSASSYTGDGSLNSTHPHASASFVPEPTPVLAPAGASLLIPSASYPLTTTTAAVTAHGTSNIRFYTTSAPATTAAPAAASTPATTPPAPPPSVPTQAPQQPHQQLHSSGGPGPVPGSAVPAAGPTTQAPGGSNQPGITQDAQGLDAPAAAAAAATPAAAAAGPNTQAPGGVPLLRPSHNPDPSTASTRSERRIQRLLRKIESVCNSIQSDRGAGAEGGVGSVDTGAGGGVVGGEVPIVQQREKESGAGHRDEPEGRTGQQVDSLPPQLPVTPMQALPLENAASQSYISDGSSGRRRRRHGKPPLPPPVAAASSAATPAASVGTDAIEPFTPAVPPGLHGRRSSSGGSSGAAMESCSSSWSSCDWGHPSVGTGADPAATDHLGSDGASVEESRHELELTLRPELIGGGVGGGPVAVLVVEAVEGGKEMSSVNTADGTVGTGEAGSGNENATAGGARNGTEAKPVVHAGDGVVDVEGSSNTVIEAGNSPIADVRQELGVQQLQPLRVEGPRRSGFRSSFKRRVPRTATPTALALSPQVAAAAAAAAAATAAALATGSPAAGASGTAVPRRRRRQLYGRRSGSTVPQDKTPATSGRSSSGNGEVGCEGDATGADAAGGCADSGEGYLGEQSAAGDDGGVGGEQRQGGGLHSESPSAARVADPVQAAEVGRRAEEEPNSHEAETQTCQQDGDVRPLLSEATAAEAAAVQSLSLPPAVASPATPPPPTATWLPSAQTLASAFAAAAAAAVAAVSAPVPSEEARQQPQAASPSPALEPTTVSPAQPSPAAEAVAPRQQSRSSQTLQADLSELASDTSDSESEAEYETIGRGRLAPPGMNDEAAAAWSYSPSLPARPLMYGAAAVPEMLTTGATGPRRHVSTGAFVGATASSRLAYTFSNNPLGPATAAGAFQPSFQQPVRKLAAQTPATSASAAARARSEAGFLGTTSVPAAGAAALRRFNRSSSSIGGGAVGGPVSATSKPLSRIALSADFSAPRSDANRQSYSSGPAPPSSPWLPAPSAASASVALETAAEVLALIDEDLMRCGVSSVGDGAVRTHQRSGDSLFQPPTPQPQAFYQQRPPLHPGFSQQLQCQQPSLLTTYAQRNKGTAGAVRTSGGAIGVSGSRSGSGDGVDVGEDGVRRLTTPGRYHTPSNARRYRGAQVSLQEAYEPADRYGGGPEGEGEGLQNIMRRLDEQLAGVTEDAEDRYGGAAAMAAVEQPPRWAQSSSSRLGFGGGSPFETSGAAAIAAAAAADGASAAAWGLLGSSPASMPRPGRELSARTRPFVPPLPLPLPPAPPSESRRFGRSSSGNAAGMAWSRQEGAGPVDIDMVKRDLEKLLSAY